MDKKQHIKEVALNLFKKSGRLTAREIASNAHVNVASVNYYFGSKDNLIQEIIKTLTDELKNNIITPDLIDQNINVIKDHLANQLYDYTQESPGLFIYIFSAVTNQSSDSRTLLDQMGYFEVIHHFIKALIKKHAELTDEEEVHNRVIIFTSSLAVSLITAGVVEYDGLILESRANTFVDKNQFISYVSSLFELVLKK